MKMFAGTGVDTGIAVGPACLLPPRIEIGKRLVATDRVVAELERFEAAVATTDADMEQLGRGSAAATTVEAEFVDAHRAILRSDELAVETKRLIRERSL